MLGLFSVSVFAIDSNLTSQERVQTEAESFLRHSGYKTKIDKNGVVHSSKNNSTIRVKIIALSSDGPNDQGVLCYISTKDSVLYDSLSKDLDSFEKLSNINITIMKDYSE